MDLRELALFLRDAKVELKNDGDRLFFTPKEKIAGVLEWARKYKSILLMLAGGFRDWQGYDRTMRFECEGRHCPTCEDWSLYMPEGKTTGLCVSKMQLVFRLGKDKRRK